jgi:hypothetical protein
MHRDGFTELVTTEWNAIQFGNSPIERWKIRLDILDNTFVVGQRILVASTKKRKKGLLF